MSAKVEDSDRGSCVGMHVQTTSLCLKTVNACHENAKEYKTGYSLIPMNLTALYCKLPASSLIM